MTSFVYRKRQAQQEEREAYRAAARDLCGDVGGRLIVAGDLKVPVHADVQPVEDGAFVECVVFVPRSKIERKVTS